MDKSKEDILFSKLDVMDEKITDIKICVASLPCKIHEEKFKALSTRIKLQWALIVLILGGIIGLSLKTIS